MCLHWPFAALLLFFAGEYSFCFSNRMNRYSSKVVYFYLLSYVYADWERFANEVQELHGEMQNFTVILTRLY